MPDRRETKGLCVFDLTTAPILATRCWTNGAAQRAPFTRFTRNLYVLGSKRQCPAEVGISCQFNKSQSADR